HDSPPKGGVNAAYLKGVLNFDTNDAAETLVRALAQVGLIDRDGKLTDLAYQWRDDDQYKEVCDKMLESGVYPQTLLDTHNRPQVSRQDVEKWFLNDMHTGRSAAQKSASFYQMLLEGDPAKLEPGSRQRTSNAASKASVDAKTRPSNTR